MRNFCITDGWGNEHWISRSIAAVVFFFAKDIKGERYILAVERGENTPDLEYRGTYCAPCGYLDYDETIVQAAARELWEETGLTVPISDFKLWKINDNPKDDKRQNITFRYIVNSLVPVEDLEKLLTTKNSEDREVSGIRFNRLVNIDKYKWAFNHENIIKEIIEDGRVL